MFDRFSQLFTKSHGIYLNIKTYKGKELISKYDRKRASFKLFAEYFLLIIEGEKLQLKYGEIINFNFIDGKIEFALFIDETNSHFSDFSFKRECTMEIFQIEFIERTASREHLHYFKRPLVEYKCDFLLYNSTHNKFDRKRPMSVQLYRIEDSRSNIPSMHPHFNQYFAQLPLLSPTIYIKTDKLDQCTAESQFFVEKNERAFIFITEESETKKIVFREALDFLNFNSLYITSFGEGYFSLQSEQEESSFVTASESSDRGEEIMKSYVTDLKIGKDPNRSMGLSSKNIFVTDGQSLAIINKDIEQPKKAYLRNIVKDASKLHVRDDESLYFLDSSLKKLDLQKEKVVYSIGDGLKDIYDYDENLNAITDNSIVQVDERANELINLNKYKTKVGFSVATNSKKLTAVGSSNGDIRIYKGSWKRAIVHIFGYGTECLGISIYGKYLAATYKNYIILIYGKNGENLEELRKSKVETKKLTLSLKHTLLLKDCILKPALFTEDGYLFSAAGNYIVSWDIQKIRESRNAVHQSAIIDGKEGYRFEKYEDQIIADRIKEGKLYILMEDKIQLDNVEGFGYSIQN